MSQLQSVLRRSVAHLDPSDHDGRERVFVNAREAMIRLLWSYDPPLSPKEIDNKIDEFDDIVAAILDETPPVADNGIDEIPADDELPDEDPDDEELVDEGRDEEDLADTDEHDVAPTPPEPPALSGPVVMAQPVVSDRRAEALAILRRPARFEPLPQIGSPTPGITGTRSDPVQRLSDPTVQDAGESALLAKQAVEQALARLNGRLAPVEDDELLPANLGGPDDEGQRLDDEALPEDDTAPEDAGEDDAAPEDVVAEDDAAEDEFDNENRPEAFDDEPGDDTDEADGPDAYEDADEPDEAEDEADDHGAVEARARTGSHVAHRRRDENPNDADAGGALSDDPFDDDDEAARPTFGARFGDAIGRISGRALGAIAAVVILLAGGLLGTTYFLGRDGEPQVTAAAPEPPAPQPATPEAAPAQSTPEPTTTPPPAATPEPAQPPAEIPSGGLALETLSLFDGRDPSVFQSSPGNPIRFEGDTLGGFARIASSPNGATPRITVGRGVFERLAGRTVRIVVVARAAANEPANSLRFSYQNGRSLSPWHDGALGADYAPLSLTWTVPKERGGPETDAVMIEPGIPGDGTAADVSSVRIEILK